MGASSDYKKKWPQPSNAVPHPGGGTGRMWCESDETVMMLAQKNTLGKKCAALLSVSACPTIHRRPKDAQMTVAICTIFGPIHCLVSG